MLVEKPVLKSLAKIYLRHHVGSLLAVAGVFYEFYYLVTNIAAHILVEEVFFLDFNVRLLILVFCLDYDSLKSGEGRFKCVSIVRDCQSIARVFLQGLID